MNKAEKENRKFGAAVSHCAFFQPRFLFCCALSWNIVRLRVPSLTLHLLQLKTRSSGAQMLQAHALSAPCSLLWHHYLGCKQLGTEICTALLGSCARHLSIQLCQWNIYTQVLSPILSEWKRPCAHFSSLQVIIRRMGTTAVRGCPTGGTLWGCSLSISSEQQDKV